MKPVTIFQAFNAPEAQLVRSQLDAAGFHAFVADEFAAPWMGGFSTATSIRVQVPESEAEDAKAFLAAPPSAAAE